MLGKRQNSKGSTWGVFYLPRTTRDSGIFVTDQHGYIFTEFFKVLADEKGIGLPPLMLKHPDRAMNEYVRNYGLVAIVRGPDKQTTCYSVEYRNKLPAEFTDRLRSYLEIMPDATILWSDDVFKEPREAPAREVIFGQRPEKPPKRETRAEIQKKWAHPQELKQDEIDYLLGKSKEPPKP